VRSAPTPNRVLFAAAASALAALAPVASVATPAAAAPAAGRDRSGTVWLCRPGLAGDPCTGDLATTVVARNGATHVVQAAPAKSPRVDCFYVYPTVSAQKTANANLRVDPEERVVAVAQASRFSQVCRVYAPMYRQITLGTILKPGGITVADGLTAYTSVLAAFRDYLAHYNHGRGIVFIGHSQGASVLIALLKREVDGKPAVRRRLVSALLLGGNVTVPVGKRVGGDFAHIPSCRARHETGCVVAYSSFTTPPPRDSKFGRVGTGLDPLGRSASPAGLQIMCVNPAAPAGGTAALDPAFPAAGVLFLAGRGGARTKISTPWVAYPGEYTARCRSAGGATWLQIDTAPGSSDRRPVVRQSQGASWGLHVVDVNIALGNLVALVGGEAASYHR
jgi:hypothetical protein